MKYYTIEQVTRHGYVFVIHTAHPEEPEVPVNIAHDYYYIPAGHPFIKRRDEPSGVWTTVAGHPATALDGRPFWWLSEDDLLKTL